MKLLPVVALLLAACTPVVRAAEREHASSSKRVWIRRATLVAGCAASLLFDTMSTQRVAAAGGIETNGLLANPQGRPQWGRIISVKAGVCGASAILQETHVFGISRGAAADWTWTGVNAATTSVYTWGGIHNLEVARELARGKF
jgi:hypothetical protein